MFICSLCGDKFDRIHMCREPEGLTFAELHGPNGWWVRRGREMDAARAAQGRPDSLVERAQQADRDEEEEAHRERLAYLYDDLLMPTAEEMGEAVKLAVGAPKGRITGHHIDRIVMDDRNPGDRRILQWMRTAYMEAARAGQGKPDALQIALSLGCWYCGSRDPCGCREEADSAIWGADTSKPVDLACACPDCVDGPEAKPEPECDVWLISPASLPTSLRSGAENGKGKARVRTMVYDFEEVP